MKVKASSGSGGGGGGLINPTYNSSLIKNVEVVAGKDTTNNKGFVIGTFTTVADIPANTPFLSGVVPPNASVSIDNAVFISNFGLGRQGIISTNGDVSVSTIIGHVGTGRDLRIWCYYDL